MDPAPSAVPPAQVLDALARRRLLVVSGKGGVGRTTVAATLGMALAGRGRRVLVATTGLDDRLAWMLGAPHLEPRAHAVAPRLWIQRLDPQVCVREYGALILHSERISGGVFDNRIVRRLLRAIPGLDDFAVLGKAWHEATRGGHYDVVVFDGPATGHLRYVLGIPQAILRAVPRGPLTNEASAMQAHLEDRSITQAVLVGVAEPWPLTELGELGHSLREQLRMDIGVIVVNALWPADLPRIPPVWTAGAGDALIHLSRIGEIGRRQRAAIEQWRAREAAACGNAAVLELPWRFDGLDDAAAMQCLVAALEHETASVHSESA